MEKRILEVIDLLIEQGQTDAASVVAREYGEEYCDYINETWLISI